MLVVVFRSKLYTRQVHQDICMNLKLIYQKSVPVGYIIKVADHRDVKCLKEKQSSSQRR